MSWRAPPWSYSLAAAVIVVLFGVVGLIVADGPLERGPVPDTAGPVVTDGGVTYRQGTSGLGDQYFPEAGNGGYDVSHYHLEIRYDPASGRLDGHAVITAIATENLFRFDLDFGGLAISSLAVNSSPAGWARQSLQELVIVPVAGLRAGREFTVDVRYGGLPGSDVPGTGNELEGFIRTPDGAVVAGEPHSATDWFPVNDHPRDKATYDFALTVPDGVTAVANGVLDGSESRDGWTTWRWSEHAPMASYLATVAIGRFRLMASVHNGLPVYSAVAATLQADVVDPIVARTPEIVDFLASLFGPYPFESMGAIVPDARRLSFALETQTRPVYAPSFFFAGTEVDKTSLLAHELAHQWYGDSVSLSTWRDIWLNEGFATYAQWLWEEHLGAATVAQSFDRTYAAAADGPVWQPPPGDPGEEKLFGASVYHRGAMTLQALRVAVGDEKFFAILRGWAAAKHWANATTAEFVAFSEQLSGRSLKALFDAWLNTDAKPPPPGR
jgi:aminopeptidase N